MKTRSLMFFIIALVPGAASAQEISKGEKLFTACAVCHGGNGRDTTMSTYPKIGGQNLGYLVNALKAYRDGKRQGGLASLMTASAKKLSDQDIADVAAYINALQAN